MRVFRFLRAYVQSMRLYYSFITGIAGWVGVSYYDFISTPGNPERTIEIAAPSEKKLVILAMLFLSWGLNQIINDFLGLKEDRINAPDRPMVTGELPPYKALAFSGVLLLAAAVVTWVYLEPIAIIFLVIGLLLNIVYEYAKAYGILGNIVFGLMITMAPLYGAYASGPTNSSFMRHHRISVLLLIWLINALMTFYTYFKDYKGDKRAGKNTLVVRYGLGTSRWIAIIAAFLPTIAFFVLRAARWYHPPLNPTFIILGVLTIFLQVWTGLLYYFNPTGVKAYSSLETNFRACACCQATLIAVFKPDLAIWLFIFSYIFVGFLFDLHRNPKS